MRAGHLSRPPHSLATREKMSRSQSGRRPGHETRELMSLTRMRKHNGAPVSKYAMVRASKSRSCTDCEISFPPEVMQFDHVPERGPKLFGIAGMLGRSLTEIAVEIRKCDVVCPTCHALRTYYRQAEAAVT